MTDTAVSFSKEEFKKKVVSNCKSLYRKNIDEADKQQVFQSVAYAVCRPGLRTQLHHHHL